MIKIVLLAMHLVTVIWKNALAHDGLFVGITVVLALRICRSTAATSTEIPIKRE